MDRTVGIFVVDARVGAFTQGMPLDPASLANVVPLAAKRPRVRS